MRAIETLPELAEYATLARSFRRSLSAENRSPQTIRSYLTAVDQLGAFLAAQRMPTLPAHIRREHVEEFINDLLGRWKPATALNRYKSLVQWFRWLLDEREIEESPMARMHPPAVPEDPPPVLREQALRRLL